MILASGLVTVAAAGTKVRLTANEGDPSKELTVQSFLVVAKHNNTGRIFIGDSNLDKATGAGVIDVLAIPTDNSIPSFGGSSSYATINDLYIDAEVSGEGAYVSWDR